MSQVIFLLSCVVLFIVPLMFVLNSVYQDGVVGRASLLAISFGAAAFVGETAFGNGFYVPPIAVWIVAACTVFLVWHLFRFHRRVLKERSAP